MRRSQTPALAKFSGSLGLARRDLIVARPKQAAQIGGSHLMAGGSNMSKFLLTVCAFGLFFSSALAQEKSLEELDKRSSRIMVTEGLQKEEINRIVASGTKQRIGFYTALHPDCTASGVPNNQNTARSRL